MDCAKNFLNRQHSPASYPTYFGATLVISLLVCRDGAKMSKRKKNYPDPLSIVNKYGADALRWDVIVNYRPFFLAPKSTNNFIVYHLHHNHHHHHCYGHHHHHHCAVIFSSSFSRHIPNTGSRTNPEVSVSPANCLKEAIAPATLYSHCSPNIYWAEL